MFYYKKILLTAETCNLPNYPWLEKNLIFLQMN